jgi:hypothetical protein
MASTVIFIICGQGDDGTVKDGSGDGGVCPKPHPRDPSKYFAFSEETLSNRLQVLGSRNAMFRWFGGELC